MGRAERVWSIPKGVCPEVSSLRTVCGEFRRKSCSRAGGSINTLFFNNQEEAQRENSICVVHGQPFGALQEVSGGEAMRAVA